MKPQRAFLGSVFTTVVHSTALDELCTPSHVQASLPANGSISGIAPIPSSVTANAVYNASVSVSDNYPAATFDYCNVTFSYTHVGRNDIVNLQYWLPSPDKFQKRYLATGGGGFAINSGTMMLPSGLQNGAVAGVTDGGFGSFSTQLDAIFLLANGTINYEPLFMFGYRAIGEQTKVGKALAKNFFSMNSTEKLYTYYQGCSEGGREGWSQVQRYPEEYDGVIPGAPAFRFAQQQVQHLYSNVVEQTLDYYPSTCEFDKIANETIKACDSLDGKTDGVVARTDLCILQFNVSSLVGTPYFCTASAGSSPFPGGPAGSPTPVQNGTISAKGAEVAQTILNGLHDSQGRRAYISYQPATTFVDGATKYNNITGEWELSINSMGGEYVTKFLQLVNISNLPNLDNVTYDTLRDWMQQGWTMYEDTLQTTLPDLTPYQSKGGKVLHWHGESDNSIPTGSSVHYHESVRSVMYPSLSFNESSAALSDWYKLFLVPGAAHCATNPLQPNGAFPNTNLAVMIDWVENAVEPSTLNATHLTGSNLGAQEQLCAWPLRPYYSGNATSPACVYDQKSIDSWMYDFNAYKLPLY
ncbi:Tannase/feruloyl esterase [Lophiotrema nucula]|uniref:Carboxylic ester hydrolase n=1 Tax=Lophiotrema nucula TaxID=690887 RepID=A0A6A5ZN89_9PLEO|nr:Tannase/feruloyl esterase [Lophiotrema nucula]